MAVLIRPRSWGALKPPVGSSINWGHPLAQGLYLCFPFNEQCGAPRDLVRGIQSVPTPSTGTVGWVPNGGRRTIGIAGATTGKGYWSIGTEGTAPLVGMPTAACTVMIAKNRVSASTVASEGFGIDLNGVSDCHAYLPFSDGTVYWDYGGQTGANRVSIGGLSFGDDLWAFVAGRRGSSIWQNGVLRASQATAISRTQGTGVFDIGNSAQNVVGDADARYGLFYVWSRELSGAEIRWLQSEPFAFLVPAAPKLLSFDLAQGGGGSGNGGFMRRRRRRISGIIA